MSFDQCPYVVSSLEEDPVYNCRLPKGHSNSHEDYSGIREGWWYVKDHIKCPSCGLVADEREFVWVELSEFPPVDQRKRR